MATQQHVEITSTLYKCREQQLFISGESGFVRSFNKWKPVIVAAMEKHKCSVLSALIKLGELEQVKDNPDSGMLMHVLNAVAVEMLEPTVTASLAGSIEVESNHE